MCLKIRFFMHKSEIVVLYSNCFIQQYLNLEKLISTQFSLLYIIICRCSFIFLLGKFRMRCMIVNCSWLLISLQEKKIDLFNLCTVLSFCHLKHQSSPPIGFVFSLYHMIVTIFRISVILNISHVNRIVVSWSAFIFLFYNILLKILPMTYSWS